MQNKKGFVGTISLLVVVIIAALLIYYFMRSNWFGGGIKTPSLSGQKSDVPAGDVNGQLDVLRQDVKTLQNQKDKEIMDELNK